ncbi:PREDICTED: putative t-complex protein 10A homolog 2 [Charadrius vociferus]|nr:PREDICTED: putative t-complex protein 10A homolog 2 [Charadrius vociferus]
MDFGKPGMEADAFKEEEHMSQRTANDLASIVPSSKIITEKVTPSLSPGWVDNMNEPSGKQCPLLYSSEASGMMGNINDSTDNLGHDQAFQHARQLCYLASSDFFPQKLASRIHDASDTLEVFTPPLLPTSEPVMNHCAPTYKNTEETPGQQDQVMRQHMEQLQRLVVEQQKIIALYNPGFSVSPGIPSHQVATMPPLPCFPATFIPVQFPSENSSQVEILERLQTSPLAMHSARQGRSPLFMPNESSSEISGEHMQLSDSGISTEPLLQCTRNPTKKLSRQDAQEENSKEDKDNSQLKERSFPETFSVVKGEQRERVKEEVPPSPFGIDGKMKTGNIEDRPITPAIGFRQKPSEEFVEKQLIVDNHLTAKQQKEQQSRAKVTIQKAFLKRKDGIARLKKKKQKPLKEDSRHSRRAGLDWWGHFSQPGQVDAGILQPGGCSQLNLQVSSSVQMSTHEKKTGCALAELEMKAQTDCKAKVVEQSAEEKEVIGRDEDAKENPVDSPQRKWPEILQSCPETITEMNLQVGEERETHHMDSPRQAGRTDGRPVAGTLQKDLGRADQPLKDHLTEGAKNPLGVLQKHSPLQDLETDRIKKPEMSAGPAFTQGQKWVQICPQELVLGSQSSESKRQIHTGFKMVNDKIVKITCSSPEAVEKGSSSSALQQKCQRKGTAALTWPVASSSCQSSCLSSNSDDDPKSHHAQYPSQHGPQGVGHSDGRLDLSDGDYASDEPSGTEKMSVKKYTRSPPRKQDIQAISRQQGSTSSSDSSTGKQMDKLKTVRSQELTHPLEYNRDEIYPLQEEKNAHSKFKGTARVTEENMKSEEIQILKQQIAGLQEEFKRNESCWHAAYGQLRDQVEMLTRQNMELRDELRVSEHQRRKAEKNPEAVIFTDRKSETPVLEDIICLIVSEKCRSLPISDSSEDMTLSHNHSNNTCSFELYSNNEETEPLKSILSRRSVLYQERRKIEEEVQEKIEHQDGKVEEVLTDGRRIITFRNGTKKEISADRRMTTISFSNGDVKKIMPDQRVIYYYADAQTTHTAYPDGLEVLQFPNNQIEKHYPDGTQEIVFPDHTVKRLYSDGFKETFFPDGTVVKVEKNGDKIVVFSNGQKEVHTAQFKRREYPDGTVKTVFCNGRQETKYSTGRVRIKDEDGNIILDKK